MKTITFDGDTRDEAEVKKNRWIEANKGVTVREMRVLPRFVQSQPGNKLRDPTSIEVDYDEPSE